MTQKAHKDLVLVVRTAAQLARTVVLAQAHLPETEVLGLAISDTQRVPVGPAPAGVNVVVFSSMQGVHTPEELGLPAQMPVWCVGAMTAAAAEQAGWRAVQLGGGNAATLAGNLLTAGVGSVVWHIRAQNAGTAWHGVLQAQGMQVVATVGYQTRFADALPVDMVQRLRAAAAVKRWRCTILMSRKSAEHLLLLLEQARIEPKGATVVISEAVAACVRSRFGTVLVAAQPTLEGILGVSAEVADAGDDNKNRG